jgi:putative addiction module component (TIGR02574 family)
MEKRAIEELALRLPATERAELAEKLLSSLDKEENAAEIEELWVQEAEKRYAAYKRGEISARSAEEIFRDAQREIG